jgi:hypothetical protein
MMRASSVFSGCTMVAALTFGVVPAFAWNDEAHRRFSERAANESVMASYLRHELRLPGGLEEPITRAPQRTRAAVAWISDGAVDEDRPVLLPFPRVRHHFHNPTLPWSEAGLPAIQGQSAIVWAQNPRQDERDGGGTHAWQDARRHFRTALTAAETTERQTAFADLFATLGHQIHLIQDAANPAHTRNDAHPVLELAARPLFGDPDRFHFWAETRDNFDRAFLSPAGTRLPSQGPAPSVLAREANELAPVPTARLIDTEQYRPLYERRTVSPPAGLDIGIAEYSSAHFFSDDTILRGLAIPSAATTLRDGGEIDPRTGRARWYLLSRTAPTPEVPRVALATMSALDRDLPDPLRTTKLKLSQKVFADTAKLLFPRAVGYSTALLDYFFRGRLDVNVRFPAAEPDGESNPEMRELFGVNASGETLGPGSLSVYAEDLATGRRDKVGEAAVPPTSPGGPILDAEGNPIRFRVGIPAARYVVVFSGILGQEAPIEAADPASSFVGAVVGKVIGGEQPEGIVPGARPVLRTPKGTFNLPPDADGLDQTQWGDRDNTFVGVVSLDPDDARPDRVKAFRIARPEGSAEVPTQAHDARVVSVDTLKSVAFPFGASLDTVVSWRHTKRFAQSLVTYELKQTHVFRVTGEGGEGFYELVATDVGAPEVETPVVEEIIFERSFPLILDEAHRLGQPGVLPRPYGWRVNDVGLDAQSRLLAVVEVRLTAPEPDFGLRHVTLRSRDGDCVLGARGPHVLAAGFPIANLLSVLLDVETGRVLGTTGTGAIAPRTVEHETTSVLQVRHTSVFEGGPLAGTQAGCADASYLATDERYGTRERATLAMPPMGVSTQTIEGWYRADVDALVATTPQIHAVSHHDRRVYFVDHDAGVNHAAALEQPAFYATGYRTQVAEAVRIRPATTSDPRVLVRFGRPVGIAGDGEEAVLLEFSPTDPTQSRLAFPHDLPPARYTLTRATPQTALLRAEDPLGGEPSSLLVEFAPAFVRAYAGRDLSGQFALLAPDLLYNVEDTRFYTLQLEQTALPLALEAGPTGPQSVADFHVITSPAP